ncbi:MAG: acyl-CoA thioesterase [Bacteroidia bacterium]
MKPENAKELIQISIKPYWSQMDVLGHINNSVYFTYCEQARIAWLEQIGFGHSFNGKSKVGPVIINAACTFHKAVVYPSDLTVTVFGAELGRSSFMTYYEITQQGILYTSGSSKIVWVDYELEKSVEVPEVIRSILS